MTLVVTLSSIITSALVMGLDDIHSSPSPSLDRCTPNQHMKASDLNDVLTGASTGQHLQTVISDEVESYRELMKKKGSSIPIFFFEDKDILISNDRLKRLLLVTIEGTLATVALSYICDCLTLGEKVSYENENLKDIIYEIADPEINLGYQTVESMKAMIARLC